MDVTIWLEILSFFHSCYCKAFIYGWWFLSELLLGVLRLWLPCWGFPSLCRKWFWPSNNRAAGLLWVFFFRLESRVIFRLLGLKFQWALFCLLWIRFFSCWFSPIWASVVKKPWTFISMKFYLGEGKKTKRKSNKYLMELWNHGKVWKEWRTFNFFSRWRS